MMLSVTNSDGIVFIYAGFTIGIFVMAASTFLMFRKVQSKREIIDYEQKAIEVTENSYPAGTIHIYFGSQTGTAEGFAKTIGEEASRNGFFAQVIDLEDFDADKLVKADKAIFLMATYGEGDPTDSALRFAEWLKDVASQKSLVSCQVTYTVFGLGNRQYEHYNQAGKSTDARLTEAGLKRMFDYGEGDDDGQIEEDFDAWKEKLWPALALQNDYDCMQQINRSYIPLPFKLYFLSTTEDKNELTRIGPAASSRHFWQAKSANITVNKELQKQPSKSSTRHIEIDIKDAGLSYVSADNLSVLPENCSEAVEIFAKHQNYDLNAIFTLEYEDNHKAIFPTPCTVRQALTCYLDICGVPRKGVLERFVNFVTDRKEHERLELLVSREGRAEFRTFVTDARRTLVELFCEVFTSIIVPFPELLCLVPHMQPRDYTISSSSSLYPTSIHITAAVLKENLCENRRYQGLCTRHLEALEPSKNSCIRAFIRNSSFRLPKDTSKPIIMIGPGTGIAPMRALIQERKFQNASGSNVLYFGCRKLNEDYIYRDELEEYLNEGVLTALRTAFSRETAKKIYVQDVIRMHAAETWKYIFKLGAYVYVCGGTSMGNDVHSTFTEICISEGGLSSDEAKKFMQNLHTDGRYVQELWS